VNMDLLQDIATANNLLVIEDACQAHGAKYKNKKAGSFGKAAAFSFYPGKNLGAFGEGGAVVTNSEGVAEKVKMLRNHGQKQKYFHEIIGFNSRLDNLQAAILRIKLKYLDQWNNARNKLAEIYSKELLNTHLVLPKTNPDTYHVFHLYVARSQKRNELMNFLKEREIYTGIHYPIPIHLMGAFKNLDYKKGDFPITEKMADEIISLPLYPEMGKEAVHFVVGAIKEFTES